MKNNNFSMVLSGVAFILLCVSMVVGLMPMPERMYSLDKIGMFLGIALLGCSFLGTTKSEGNVRTN